MARSVSWRWKSKFARFIQDYGVESLAVELDVRPSAIITGSAVPLRPVQPMPKSFSVSPASVDRRSRWTRSIGTPERFERAFKEECRARVALSGGWFNDEESHGSFLGPAGTRVTATSK